MIRSASVLQFFSFSHPKDNNKHPMYFFLSFQKYTINEFFEFCWIITPTGFKSSSFHSLHSIGSFYFVNFVLGILLIYPCVIGGYLYFVEVLLFLINSYP